MVSQDEAVSIIVETLRDLFPVQAAQREPLDESTHPGALFSSEFDFPELLIELENKFGVKLADAPPEEFRTVGRAAGYIVAQTS